MVNSDGHVGTCQPCRKRQYLSKKAAKVVAHRFTGEHVVAYRCPVEGRFWHVGHLPTPIIRGVAPKKVIFNQEAA